MDEVGAAWRRRWLLKRIANDKVLATVASQGPMTVQDRLAAEEGEQGSQIGLFGAGKGG
jgi:hypothetical protein